MRPSCLLLLFGLYYLHVDISKKLISYKVAEAAGRLMFWIY